MDVDDGQRDSRQGASDASVTAVAALADPSRRRMYDFIRQARRPIRREEAAASIGISRKLAAFHLDKLVEVGLLRAHFTPAPGVRRVGRTPKVYEPTEVEIRITVPERDPGLLADILIDAVLADIAALGGKGGLIAVAPDGEAAWGLTTPAMYRGMADADGRTVRIYAEEEER